MSKDMKLIMERFRKSLNEMPGGSGMGLKVGAATAAGKADAARKAVEDKKKQELERHAIDNFGFWDRLRSLGSDPQYIEIEPGDIKGIDYPKLVELMNGAYDGSGTSTRFSMGDFTDVNSNIRLMTVIHRWDGDARTYEYEPAKISGEELASILRNVLEPEGLWIQGYRRRTD